MHKNQHFEQISDNLSEGNQFFILDEIFGAFNFDNFKHNFEKLLFFY
jgi:hypothetical protein